MQILLSCAKTMGHTLPACEPVPSVPRFADEADRAIRMLMQLSPDEVGKMLKVNGQIAAENVMRYADFFADNTLNIPALLAYTGIVFKQIGAADFDENDWQFAGSHLFITSFLYGLLRPTDAIRPYRLEGNARLPYPDGPTRFEHWQDLLTDVLIEETKRDDGVLVNLASAEMKRLFRWTRVKRELKVLTPDFKTVTGEKERSVVVYTKMCRGQMTRFILKNRLTDCNGLMNFEPDVADAAVVVKWL